MYNNEIMLSLRSSADARNATLKHDNGTHSRWQVSCGLDPLACYSRGKHLTPKSYFIVQLQCRGGIEIIAAQ